ncbi:toll/interleukin-1 receptor domain-containing protein [Primorskyibacter flagellatus]|uniref:TIR domain-containing protein n=1 Tax=Primorskyibacter flagellatus TaxID=1387277 RepID=A0A1W2EQQ3_9RHOB|nr:toll/interleukin-1 receptor domain-containing protein [Primorskyibacter flagellatus]SMD12054.1 TIR domain-containing protein [Primorskyibacter flagellatus]
MPSDPIRDAFLSYAREDLRDARRLYALLEDADISVAMDVEDLAPGERFQERLDKLLEGSAKLVYLATEQSKASDPCQDELALAAREGKPILPVLLDDTPASVIPSELSDLHYTRLRSSDDWEAGLGALAQSLKTDLAWERTKASYLLLDFEGKGLLQTREALREAEQWARQRPRNTEPIPPAVWKLLSRSRARLDKRRRLFVGLGLGGLTGVIAVSVMVSWLSIQARQQGDLALSQSLAGIESVVRDAANENRNSEDALTDSLIDSGCNIAARLSVDGRIPRSPATVLACDIHYALSTNGPETGDEQHAFLNAEFARLDEAAGDYVEKRLAGDLTDVASLDALDEAMELHFDVLDLRHGRVDIVPITEYSEELETALTYAGHWLELLIAFGEAGAADLANRAAGTTAYWGSTAAIWLLDGEHTPEKPDALIDDSLEKVLQFDTRMSQAIADAATTRDASVPAPDISFFHDMLIDVLVSLGEDATQERMPTYFTEALRLVPRLPEEQRADRLSEVSLQTWTHRYRSIPEDDFPGHDALLNDMIAGVDNVLSGDTAAARAAQPKYDELLEALVAFMHEILDDQRDIAIELASTDPPAAHTMLADTLPLRQDLYRKSSDESAWARLFILSGEERLALFEDDMGLIDDAQTRRIETRARLTALDLDRATLDRDERTEYARLEDHLHQAFYRQIDTMRNEASKVFGEEDTATAIAHMQRLRQTDRAWDLALPEPREFDRVYTLESGLQLGSYLWDANRKDEAGDVVRRAIREYLPIKDYEFSDGDNARRAREAWEVTQRWIEAYDWSETELTPISTLLPLDKDVE